MESGYLVLNVCREWKISLVRCCNAQSTTLSLCNENRLLGTAEGRKKCHLSLGLLFRLINVGCFYDSVLLHAPVTLLFGLVVCKDVLFQELWKNLL